MFLKGNIDFMWHITIILMILYWFVQFVLFFAVYLVSVLYIEDIYVHKLL